LATFNHRRRRIGFLALIALSIYSAMPIHAAIVPAGDYTPVYNGVDDPWDVGEDLTIGDTASGELVINAGSELSNFRGYLGLNVGSAGIATITDSGTTWSNTGRLYVGNYGDGSLSIENGGSVSADNGVSIGYRSSSTGSVTIDGVGSTLSSPYGTYLNVGSVGNGTLTIANGGEVNSWNVYVAGSGINATSTGSIVVTGLGSTWTNIQDFYLGRYGIGSLTIESGGVVSSGGLYIGDKNYSSGTVTVTGPGSTLIVGSHEIGTEGYGSLQITDAGTVRSGAAFIGRYELGSTPTVTVSGTNSNWTIVNIFNIGYFGNALLSVEDGGEVTSSFDAYIGAQSQGNGAVVVSGVDSIWSAEGDLYVGGLGKGQLTINNGGVVNVTGDLIIGDRTLSSGVVGSGTVRLAGGSLNLNEGSIAIGAGEAEFIFTAGIVQGVGIINLSQPFKQQGGTLAPGNSIGQTDIVGEYNLTAGTVEIELGGLGNPRDRLTATGNIDIALLGTTLDLPALGAMSAGTYTIIESTGGTITGTFENVTGIGLYAGLVDVQYTSNAVSITLNWDFLPGDLNGDGFVGVDDLNIILPAWNQSVTPGDLSGGDLTGDGFVGIDDLNVVLVNWNAGTPPPGEALALVPEPGTVGVLAITGGLFGYRRRRL
jgi:fibronectin-binding autotransporter adhesin